MRDVNSESDQDVVGRVSPPGGSSTSANVGSGDPAYNKNTPSDVVGRVPSPGEKPPRRLRRLKFTWCKDNNYPRYLLTICVEGRVKVLADEKIFQRFSGFLLESPGRYHWFPQRFVIMPDHIHLIVHQHPDAISLGQWVKAMKAVVAGLERRVRAPGLQQPRANESCRPGALTRRGDDRIFTRTPRTWRWQDSFHDHVFRTRESESRKWEYVCMNPVRAALVEQPEDWPYGGEIIYDENGIPTLLRKTPPLLENAVLIPESGKTPGEGTRPTTREKPFAVVGRVPLPGAIAYPLDEFYRLANRELPRIEQIAGEKIPEPYKSLLVHDSDMTSTLEKFHGAKIHLKLLSRRQEGDFYFREVVLVLNGDEKPVEFGAIKINLGLFASGPRKKILEERYPLGHILRDSKIAHASQPKAFFKIQSDDFINREFGLKNSEWLFGRRNTLTNPNRESLAEIVEILPP